MIQLLTIKDLSVRFSTRFGEFTALDSIDVSVSAGQVHGLVGESGAGKSTVGSAIMGLLPSSGYIDSGDIFFSGINLAHINNELHHRLRGDRISMIFQDPQTSLNPLLTVAAQMIETICQHRDISVSMARQQSIMLLSQTGIQDVENRIDDYPHQFSGGMRQRVVIALAICTDPELIIADEPTTALDVSVQKQILQMIKSLCVERNIGIILITHDIGVINEIADRVTVLRSGRVVETGNTSEVLRNPQHNYTKALMAAVPRLDLKLKRFKNIVTGDTAQSGDHDWRIPEASASFAREWLLTDRAASQSECLTESLGSPLASHTVDSAIEPKADSLLAVSNLTVTFNTRQAGWFGKKSGFKALSGINLEVKRGEVLGVVGESGSGKSTLAKTIVGLINPSAGKIQFAGHELPYGKYRARHHGSRQNIQMVFQDPYSSLNNRKTVEYIISEPIRFYGLGSNRAEVRKLVASVLELVEMSQSAMLRYPHQFSGGQRQRIAVARALVAQPEFLICDEPTSALDVSIQAQILNLLKDLQQTFGLSILFISHNLAVIRQMADRVVVIKNGQVVETAETENFFKAPREPYSKALLKETPSLKF